MMSVSLAMCVRLLLRVCLQSMYRRWEDGNVRCFTFLNRGNIMEPEFYIWATSATAS